MKKLLTLCFLNLVSLALCTNTVADETRKTSVRSASAAVGTNAHLNSLQSSQDSATKQQSTQQAQSGSGQTSYTRVQTPEFTSITQPHNAIYTQSQPTAPTGGYFISVNPQNVQSAAIGPGPTPVIMQYLPHNAQQGPIQYLQLIPTRPLIVPISPYISGFNNPYSSPVGGPSAQASSNSPYGLAQSSSNSPYALSQASSNSPYALPQASSNSPYVSSSSPYSSLSHHSYAPSTSSFGSSYSPASLQNTPSFQNPIGGYSTNYLTYFRPNHGMQLVNSPVDLSLNTNEYIPLQSENTYKMRRV